MQFKAIATPDIGATKIAKVEVTFRDCSSLGEAVDVAKGFLDYHGFKGWNVQVVMDDLFDVSCEEDAFT